MKTENNILIAFLLNFSFSIFEFIGGIFTGSVAILSDAVHDIGDAASIGISYWFEKKSNRQPDDQYTYGYARYSVIGSVITILILLFGSVIVTYNAIIKIIRPTEINYKGMILFAIVGVCVNFGAAVFTHKGSSLNQKSVHLHMIEDVLGWIVVLIGAIVMRFTGFILIDPIMSIGVSVFIFLKGVKNLKEAINLFLEKTPHGIDIQEIKNRIIEIDGVFDVHHIHIWSMDGKSNYATMHVVTNADSHQIKEKIRQELRGLGIGHTTLELEEKGEFCQEERCHIKYESESAHHHHHH